MLVEINELQSLVRLCLIRNGAEYSVANNVAEGLVWASARGVDSHGIRLLPHYLSGLVGGRLNGNPRMKMSKTNACVLNIDADNTFGMHGLSFAVEEVCKIAASHGIGAGAIANSSHCGALGYFGHLGAKNGFLTIVMTHATPRVLSPNSNRSFFGNNPICVAMPMKDEDPFCYDAATTLITFNAVKSALENNLPIPAGAAADSQGNMVVDPAVAEHLLPIGGYKGFGLSMVVDIFCSILTGMPSGNEVSQMFDDEFSKKRRLGHFVICLDVESFGNRGLILERMLDLSERVRREPSINETPVICPGDPEKHAFKNALEHGIEVTEEMLAILKVENDN